MKRVLAFNRKRADEELIQKLQELERTLSENARPRRVHCEDCGVTFTVTGGQAVTLAAAEAHALAHRKPAVGSPVPADEARDTRAPLTYRQHELLSAIEASVRLTGEAPSARALARRLGGVHHSSVQDRLRALEAKGYLRSPTPSGLVLEPWKKEKTNARA